MPRRICERLDNIAKKHYRARPSVSQDDRQRLCVFRSDMNEMYAQAVDCGFVLRKTVERRFPASPVIILAPVFDEGAKVAQRHALRPVGHRLTFRPACLTQPML